MRVIFLAFLLLSWANLRGQTIEKSVKVVDDTDNSGLPACVITEVGTQNHFMTNGEGVTSIPINKPRNLQIKYIGYEEMRITISKTSPSPITIRLKPMAYQLKNVRVVGAANQTRSTGVVSTLRTNVIEQGQNQSLAALMAGVAGCRILASGAQIEKPIIEGLSGSRIAIITNQAKLSGQHWGDDHAPEIDIPTYAKVTVLKSAQGVKYGANALGGVVLVDSDLDPMKDERHFSMQSDYATNGRRYGLSTFYEDKIPLIEHLRFRVAGKYYRGGDYHTAEYNLSNTGSILRDLKADLAYGNERLTLNTHFNFYNTDIGIFRGSEVSNINDLMDRFKQGRPPQSAIQPFSYAIGMPKQHVEHTVFSQAMHYKLNEHESIEAKYAFQKDYRREYGLRLGIYKDKPDFAFRLYTHALSTSWKREFDQHLIELGGNVTLMNNKTDRDTGAVPVIPNYLVLEGGLFAYADLRLNAQTHFELGVRTDKRYANAIGFDLRGNAYGGKKNYTSFGLSTGVKTLLGTHHRLNFNAGLAWRAPEMNELYSNGVHHGEAIFQQGDPNLKTEKAFKLSGGYLFNSGALRIEANGFANYIMDYIFDTPRFTKVNNELKPEVSLQNAGVFTKYFFQQTNGLFIGGDATLHINLSRDWRYSAGGEWIYARNMRTKGYFPAIPSDRYKQTIQYNHHFAKQEVLEMNLSHIYVTKQTHFDKLLDLLPETPPAYHLLEANVSFSKPLGHSDELRIYLTGQNLTNALYKDYTNRLRYYMHEKGRSITLGIKYAF